MTPITNDTNMVLRATSDARKLELISSHLGVNLAEIILEETAKEQAEQLAELKEREAELQKELVRKLKLQRDYVGNGLLSGQIIAITPKRKFFTDITKFTDADCYKIKEMCISVLNTKSYPKFAQEMHITVEGIDLLVMCRRSA
jgi:hypothetical protein